MRVPGSQAPGVGLNPLTSFNRSNSAVHAPSVNSAIGEQLGQIALQVQKAEELADNARVEERVNQARVLQMQLQTDASQQKGKNVEPQQDKTFTDIYLGKFDEGVSKIGEGLNARQRKLYEQRASLLRTEYQGKVNHHEQVELKAHVASSYWDAIKIETESARQQHQDPRTVALSMTRAQNAVASLAQLEGWSDEHRSLVLQEALTGFHANVLDAALNAGDVEGAKTYLETHAKEISSKVREKYREDLKSETRNRQVNETVDAVDAGSDTYDEKAKTLRERFKDDSKAQEMALEGLKARLVERDIANKERVGRIWDMKTGLNGGKPMSRHAIERTPEWKELDGGDRKALAEAFEQDARRNEDRMSPEDNIAKYATYLRITDNPADLAKMSDEEIIGTYTKVLGSNLTKKLLEHKREWATYRGKLQTATMDAKQFTDLAREYGLSVEGANSTEKKEIARGRLGMLRLQLNDMMSAAQLSINRELNESEKMEMMRRLLQKVPTRREKPWWPDETGEKNLFEAGIDELDVSTSEKAEAVRILKKHNAPVTTSNVWTMVGRMRELDVQPRQEAQTPQANPVKSQPKTEALKKGIQKLGDLREKADLFFLRLGGATKEEAEAELNKPKHPSILEAVTQLPGMLIGNGNKNAKKEN